MSDTAYDGVLRALDEGKIVVCTPGIDRDGDQVVCTSLFTTTSDGDEYLLHAERGVRAAYLLGIAAFARESLRERHGIERA